ncbi:MAG: CGGC domain-containing protein [Candidatus Heimdallarchaeota archaeon]|nr:CGGC domain-containing protein [Candidatus Heimdallarchaeota archaeon]
MKRIGIIICDRYKTCDGGKCFRSVREKEGTFKIYENEDVEVVGYSTCGGCPGGNIEYVAAGMKKYGADVIHFATGFLAGYPPCPYIDIFKNYIEKDIGIQVVIGTHPMPTNYIENHEKIQDIPDKYKQYWNNLADADESTKYDSTRTDYIEELDKELRI